MTPRRCPMKANDLIEPEAMSLLADHAEKANGIRRLAVPARLTLHQNELDVVFDDSVRFIWLPKERRAVLHLEGCIGDLVPDDGREVVEADLPAVLLNRGVQRYDHVGAMLAA